MMELAPLSWGLVQARRREQELGLWPPLPLHAPSCHELLLR
jgi:hypothetical protein